MFYCKKCNKEVVIIGISHGAVPQEGLEDYITSIEKEGRLVLINPPAFGPFYCPRCGTKLVTEGMNTEIEKSKDLS